MIDKCSCGAPASFGPGTCSACYVNLPVPRPEPWQKRTVTTDELFALLLGHAKQQTALLKRLVEIAEKERGE